MYAWCIVLTMLRAVNHMQQQPIVVSAPLVFEAVVPATDGLRDSGILDGIWVEALR